MTDEQINEVMRLVRDAVVTNSLFATGQIADMSIVGEAKCALVSYLRTIGEPESVNAEMLEALKDARHCIGIDRDTLVDCHTNPCTGYLDPDGALAKAEYDDVIDAADAAIARAESAIETPAKVSPCAGHAVQQDADASRDWPEDFPHENGQYMNTCHVCKNTFIGHKRRVVCKVCNNGFIRAQQEADGLVGLRGCNSRHGVQRAEEPCIYRMRTTDPGCTGCVERDEDQPAEAGD